MIRAVRGRSSAGASCEGSALSLTTLEGAMLAVGDRSPDATVWPRTREATSIAELVREGPILLLFYLYDFSAT